MGAQPENFRLLIPDAEIAALRERLLRTRLPDQGPGEPWAYGADLSYLRSLIEYWQFNLTGELKRLGSMPFLSTKSRFTALTCTSCACLGMALNRCPCFSRTAGRGPCSSSLSCFRC